MEASEIAHIIRKKLDRELKDGRTPKEIEKTITEILKPTIENIKEQEREYTIENYNPEPPINEGYL